jgi:hypothetical protein
VTPGAFQRSEGGLPAAPSNTVKVESAQQTRSPVFLARPAEAGNTVEAEYAPSNAFSFFENSTVDLGVTIDGPSDIEVGVPFTNTVTVTNKGSDVAMRPGLYVDFFSSEYGSISSDAKFCHSRSNDTIVCDFADLQPGESVSVLIDLKAKKGGRRFIPLFVFAHSDASFAATVAEKRINIH